MKIAIVGTAGRGEDAPRMSWALYRRMVARVESYLAGIPVEARELQSGGAAWADHIAVTLFLAKEKKAQSLTSYLPASLTAHGSFDPSSAAGRTANQYHRQFGPHFPHARSGDESMNQIWEAARWAKLHTCAGFLDRNLWVGQCDLLLAFTFGTGSVPKRGSGTRHTWDHSTAPRKVHFGLDDLLREQHPPLSLFGT